MGVGSRSHQKKRKKKGDRVNDRPVLLLISNYEIFYVIRPSLKEWAREDCSALCDGLRVCLNDAGCEVYPSWVAFC